MKKRKTGRHSTPPPHSLEARELNAKEEGKESREEIKHKTGINNHSRFFYLLFFISKCMYITDAAPEKEIKTTR